jgi:hypothetical protein
MKDVAVKERFVELRARGWSFNRIAKELKVSKQSLINWSREFSLEIKNRRAIEFEALLEEHSMTRQKRIEVIGQLLKRMTEELTARPLTTMPTERLLDGIIKLMAECKAVCTELTFAAEENLYESVNKNLEKTVTQWSA